MFNLLSTDSIEITIVEPEAGVVLLPSFTQDLNDVMIRAGVAQSWELPAILEGDYPLLEVLIESQYSDAIIYNSKSNEIEFDGNDSIDGLFFVITIKLVDTEANVNKFFQNIFIVSQEESQDEI